MTRLQIDPAEVGPPRNFAQAVAHRAAVRGRVWGRPAPPELALLPVAKVVRVALHDSPQHAAMAQAQAKFDGIAEARPPAAKRVILVVATWRGIDPGVMTSPLRIPSLVRARRMAMYLLVVRCGKSPTDAGRFLGGRDDATVTHHVDLFREELASDPALRQEYDDVCARLWAP